MVMLIFGVLPVALSLLLGWALARTGEAGGLTGWGMRYIPLIFGVFCGFQAALIAGATANWTGTSVPKSLTELGYTAIFVVTAAMALTQARLARIGGMIFTPIRIARLAGVRLWVGAVILGVVLGLWGGPHIALFALAIPLVAGGWALHSAVSSQLAAQAALEARVAAICGLSTAPNFTVGSMGEIVVTGLPASTIGNLELVRSRALSVFSEYDVELSPHRITLTPADAETLAGREFAARSGGLVTGAGGAGGSGEVEVLDVPWEDAQTAPAPVQHPEAKWDWS